MLGPRKSVREFTGRHTMLIRFSLIGCVTTAIQIGLQRLEVSHGYNIYWWSFFQGSILANLGMAANKKWTFKEYSLPWMWAVVCWNVQKVPHSAASMGAFALLLQIPSLPYWGATLGAAGLVGAASFVTTKKFIERTGHFDRWSATLLAAGLLSFSVHQYSLKAEI